MEATRSKIAIKKAAIVKPETERLQSLDALRGFDMFWIISGEYIVHALSKATNAPVFNWMSAQLLHTPWNGFTFYDMIFPLFIFIAGVSMPFSYGKKLSVEATTNKQARRKIYTGLIRRTVLLILLGMVVNGLLKWQGYEQTRIASVLGRIALSCFFAALIYLNAGRRAQIAWAIFLLVGYWVAMMLIPVPHFGAGVLTPEGNLEAYIDRLLLPGKLYRASYDPEGILSTIPAIVTALLGVFTGEFLRDKSNRFSAARKGMLLAISGVILLGLGLLWNLSFPINKNMWTSSFVLYAGGWSVLFFALFYLVIDVAGFRKWSTPFVWIGVNSILIYMAAHGLINFEATANFLSGGLLKFAPPLWQAVWLAVGVALVQLALLYFLYKKKLFLKL